MLEWIGRFLARIHTVGAAAPFAHRPALDIQSFGYASRDLLLAGDLGCLMNMAGKLKREGSAVQVRHVAEVLAGMTDLPAIGER